MKVPRRKRLTRTLLATALLVTALAAVATVATLQDARHNSHIPVIPIRPPVTPPAELTSVIRNLETHTAYDAVAIDNACAYVDGRLTYTRPDRELRLDYASALHVDGRRVDTEYPRFDSPWSRTPRKPSAICLRHGSHELLLDFDRQLRRAMQH